MVDAEPARASTRPGGRRARCRRRRPGTRPAGTARSVSSAIGSRPAAGGPGPGASGTSPADGRSGTPRPRARPGPGSAAAGRDDVGDRRLAEDDRDLAEELAAGQPGALGAVDDDRRLAVEDDVEPGARSGPGGGPARPRRRPPRRRGGRCPRAAASVRSANSAKPAIASTSSSRSGHASHGARMRTASECVAAIARLTARRTAGAAWPPEGSTDGGIHDPDPRPRDELLAAARCSPASTPTGWRDRGAGDRGRLPGRPVIARQGEIGTGLLRDRRAAASG